MVVDGQPTLMFDRFAQELKDIVKVEDNGSIKRSSRYKAFFKKHPND